MVRVGTKEIRKDEPMSMDDYFRFGSNTKTMTSAVILRLVQEGKLKLEDPVSKYRPEVPNGANITIAQLSEIRSGLNSYTFDKAFKETLDRDPQEAWTPDKLLTIAFFPSPQLHARRGVRPLQHEHRAARSHHREADGNVGLRGVPEAVFEPLG